MLTNRWLGFWISLLSLGFSLATCAMANTESASPPMVGTVIKYSCSGAGPTKEDHRVLYNSSSLWGIQITRADTKSPKDPKNATAVAEEMSVLEDVSPWQYLIGIPSFEESGSSFRMAVPKEGDLADLNSLTVGKTHSGVLTITDPSLSPDPFEAKVSATIVKHDREKVMALGVQKVFHINVTTENLNNDGKSLTFEVHYSPILKGIVSRTAKEADKVVRTCVAEKMAFNQNLKTAVSAVHLAMPPQGSEYSYICTGDSRILEVSVVQVTADGSVFANLTYDHERHGRVNGNPWMHHTFVAEEFLPGEQAPTVETVGGFEALKHPQKPGSYVGGINTTKKGKSKSWQTKITVFDPIKLKSPYKDPEDVNEVRATRFSGSDFLISRSFYMKRYQVPFMFEVNTSGKLTRSCWLTSFR